MLAVVIAALSGAHGNELVENQSHHYLVNETEANRHRDLYAYDSQERSDRTPSPQELKGTQKIKLTLYASFYSTLTRTTTRIERSIVLK